MRIYSVGRFAVVALSGVLVLTCTALRADDDDQQGGDDVQGAESFENDVTLTPTANAPVGSGGDVEFSAEDEDGVASAILQIDAEGLATGTYTVSYTVKSDASSHVLGTFQVADGSSSDGDDDDNGDDSGDGTGVIFGTDASPFPAGFNPFDLATLTISDANGVALLTADFTSVESMAKAVFHANVKAVASSAASAAAGHAVVNAKSKHGAAKGMLLLVGKNLPPSTGVALSVNGTDVLTTATNKRGQLKLTKSSAQMLAVGANLFSIHSLSVHDGQGVELLHASF